MIKTENEFTADSDVDDGLLVEGDQLLGDIQATAVEISRMTDLIRMQFLALHARMMKDKHQRMKERGFYKVSVAKRTVIRQCKA